jgi:N6-L-threonylcarbamoyladenine synthase/tRNA threonylcarbamoyladenosine biosynthesis protein TsaB
MKVLALETSATMGSAAIAIDDRIVAFEKSMNQRAHSEFINQAIDNCLRQAGISLKDIDVFAAGLGPGSFTGIRVAANVAKSLCYTFQKPMVAIDSLTLMAMEVRQSLSWTGPILSILNAYKNLLYTGLFSTPISATEKTFSFQTGPSAIPAQDVEKIVLSMNSSVFCVGDGYIAYEPLWSANFKQKITRSEAVLDFPSAATLALEANRRAEKHQTIEWNSYLPLYIRASEAEENLRVK